MIARGYLDAEYTDSGDDDSFGVTYELHYRRLIGALRLQGLTQQDAEDIAQEAFLRTFGRWVRVRGGTNPAGYVYRTAFRLAKKQTRPTAESIGSSTDRQDLSVDVAARAVASVAIRQALDALSDRQRACVILCHYAGFSSIEAARMLLIRPSTVRVHLHNARELLGRALPFNDDG